MRPRRAREALQKEGFGVLTEIDVKAMLKKRLSVDFRIEPLANEARQKLQRALATI